jgi:hypothetical protein
MALFTTMPTGSGGISPLFPNLVFRFSTDGLGLVFEDTSLDFLLVWNADTIARQIEYSPGLFTDTLVEHTACHKEGLLNGLIRPGPTTWDFNRCKIPFDFEIDRYPTEASSFGFPPDYTVFDNDDQNTNTHTTGDGRRFNTYPPLRGIRYHTNSAKQGEAWTAMLNWNINQLRRPLAHISAAFAPFINVDDFSNGNINVGSSRAWDFDKLVSVKNWRGCGPPQDTDGDGKIDLQCGTGYFRWNAFDPAHNETTPQFALACAGHPLGACLLFLIYAWAVQVWPAEEWPSGTHNVPFDQERSVYYVHALHLRCAMLGMDYADPNVVRDWWGGLDGLGVGAGIAPRTNLRGIVDIWAGPVYGGRGGNDARYSHLQRKGDLGFGQQPDRSSLGDFVYNSVNYKLVLGHERMFHRYIALWGNQEIIRAHDYLQVLDAGEVLLDSARVAQLRDFARQHGQYVIDVGMIGSYAGTASAGWGGFRQYASEFTNPGPQTEADAMPLSFESFAALDQAIRDAIAVKPNNPNTGQPWVYPGTDYKNQNHVFAVQHVSWERGATRWHVTTGWFSENEARLTGPAGYATTFGYDDNLQAIIDKYGTQITDATNENAQKQYEIVWRAKEKYETQGNTDRSPFAAAALGFSVVGSFKLGNWNTKAAPRFVIAASVLGSYSVSNPVSKSPPPATARALSVASPYSIGAPPPLGHPIEAAFAIAHASLGGIFLSTIPSHQLDPAFCVARATLGAVPDVTLDELRAPPKSFGVVASLLDSYTLGDRPTPPLIAFAVATSVGPATADGDVFGYRPVAASVVATSVDPSYIVTGPGGLTRRTPLPAFSIAASLPNVPGLDSLGLLPAVGHAVAVAVLVDYELSVPFANHYDKLVAFAIAVATLDIPQPGPALKNPPAVTALAIAIDPTWILTGHGEEQAPPAAFGIAASIHGGYVIAETKIPLNVQTVGVEIADVREIEGVV